MDPQLEQSQLALSLLIRQLFPRSTEATPQTATPPGTEDDKKVTQRALSSLLSRLFYPHKDAVPIVHPVFKSLGRLWIPVQFVKVTHGLERFLSQQPPAPSLCLLGREGLCNAGAACPQIHLDKAYGALIEEALLAQNVSNCCQQHGDPASTYCDIFSLSQLQIIEVRIEGYTPFRVPPQRIAVTYFWYKLLKQKRRSVWFPVNRICALHQQDACRYGVECKHVHVCRQLWAEIAKQVEPVVLAMPSPDPMILPEPLVEPTPVVVAAPPQRASKALPILDPVSGAEVTISRPNHTTSPPPEEPPATADSSCSHPEVIATQALPPMMWASPLSPYPDVSHLAFEDHQHHLQHHHHQQQTSVSQEQPNSHQRGSQGAIVPELTSVGSSSPRPEDEVDAGFRAFPKPEKKKAAKRSEDNNSPRGSPRPAPDPDWVRKMEASRGKFKGLRGGLLLGIEVIPGPESGRPGFGAGRGRTHIASTQEA